MCVFFTKVTNLSLYSSSQFHRILENWLPGDIERNSWNISSPGRMSPWSPLKLLFSMLSVCSSPPSHFSDIRECQRLKFLNVALVVATRMEDGQGLKGGLSFNFVSTASLPSPSDPRLSPAFSSGLYFALNRPLASLTRSPTFLLQLSLFCTEVTFLKRRFRWDF